jgi:hypothetical protein
MRRTHKFQRYLCAGEVMNDMVFIGGDTIDLSINPYRNQVNMLSKSIF